MSKKVSFLFFDSKDTAEFVDASIKEGKAMIDDKVFIIDENVNPKMLKKKGFLFGHSYHPFFIIRHDKVAPLDFNEKDNLENPMEITPATMKRLNENRTLAQLLVPQSDRGQALLFLALGAAIGAIIGIIAGGPLHTTTVIR